ncbi:hypothetical protein MMC25_000389 [Agyrium rufum]|nr:hypothetical protein [Agyrium rufum]
MSTHVQPFIYSSTLPNPLTRTSTNPTPSTAEPRKHHSHHRSLRHHHHRHRSGHHGKDDRENGGEDGGKPNHHDNHHDDVKVPQSAIHPSRAFEHFLNSSRHHLSADIGGNGGGGSSGVGSKRNSRQIDDVAPLAQGGRNNGNSNNNENLNDAGSSTSHLTHSKNASSSSTSAPKPPAALPSPTQADVDRVRRQRQAIEDDLTSKLAALTDQGTSTTRRLDYTFYSLLQTIPMIKQSMYALKDLSEQTARLKKQLVEEMIPGLTEQASQQLSALREGYGAVPAAGNRERGRRKDVDGGLRGKKDGKLRRSLKVEDKSTEDEHDRDTVSTENEDDDEDDSDVDHEEQPYSLSSTPQKNKDHHKDPTDAPSRISTLAQRMTTTQTRMEDLHARMARVRAQVSDWEAREKESSARSGWWLRVCWVCLGVSVALWVVVLGFGFRNVRDDSRELGRMTVEGVVGLGEEIGGLVGRAVGVGAGANGEGGGGVNRTGVRVGVLEKDILGMLGEVLLNGRVGMMRVGEAGNGSSLSGEGVYKRGSGSRSRTDDGDPAREEGPQVEEAMGEKDGDLPFDRELQWERILGEL